MPENQPTSMRTFLIVLGGQLVSLLGSEMTNFAVTIWAWELTAQATPLSLIIFFNDTFRVIAASFAGIFVDRWNRKLLMIVGDTAAGLSTIVVLLLLLTNNLQIWHLYITGAINGLFGYFQNLAQSASISMIVPKQHYTRAGAMIYYALAGSKMMAPALAGLLYYIIGLSGILMIDLVTFLIGIGTVILVKIPQPKQSEYRHSNRNLWQELTFGFRYIFKRPSLLATLIFLLSFYLVNNTIYAIRSPMILARSGNNGAVLANVQLAIGVGGVIGAMLLSIWGGPKRRIHGLLLGSAFASGSLMGLGLGNQPWIWMSAGFFMAFFSPLMDSSYTAIWLSKVEPDVQGRVFASRYLITQIASPLGLVSGGLLADHIFEPAMRTDGRLAGLLGAGFGTGPGAGMALQHTIFSLCGMLIGFSGYAFRRLRDVETLVPDHDATAS